MYEPLSDSLRKIARGAGIAIIGTSLGLLLQFIARLIIARYSLETNYGVFSLALMVLTFAATLSCLGLEQAAARYIAYFRGKGQIARVRGTISVSLQLTATASIIITIALFFSAKAIALSIFHTPDLVAALSILAMGIPFFTLINILAGFFRGFDRVEPQAYFQLILLNMLFLLLLLAVILLDLPFVAIFYTYLVALILTFVALILYTVRKLKPQPITFAISEVDCSFRKELLLFSLPLLGTAILSMIVLWMGTLMLGYFKAPEVVGLYNAAYPLTQFISQPLAAMSLIYTPLATGLYSQNLMAELRRNYAISTKWVSFLTLPVFLVLCLFPEAVLNLFFGSAYVAAAPALRILSLGFIIHNLFGPRDAMLVALGYPRFIMWSVLAGAIVNVALNIALIPLLSMVGAAIASAVSLILVDIILTTKVYSSCRAQPLSKNLFKPLTAAIVLALLFRFTIGSFLNVTLWMLPVLFILYYAIYGTAVVFTHSFDREDIALLLEIEKRSGINTEPIKKILRRFV